MTPAYRELRQLLLVRLALGAGVLIVVGVVALMRLPTPGMPEKAGMGPAAAPARSVGPVEAPSRAVAREAQVRNAMLFAIGPDDVFAEPRLEELMRPVARPEPLEGMAFEVLPKPADAASLPGAAGDDADTKVAAPRLPKGPHLQAGIFAQPANAEEFRRMLAAQGYPAYIETRVHIGPYPNRREAERVREKLKAQGTRTVFVPQ